MTKSGLVGSSRGKPHDFVARRLRGMREKTLLNVAAAYIPDGSTKAINIFTRQEDKGHK